MPQVKVEDDTVSKDISKISKQTKEMNKIIPTLNLISFSAILPTDSLHFTME